jgi:hypothetical protein
LFDVAEAMARRIANAFLPSQAQVSCRVFAGSASCDPRRRSAVSVEGAAQGIKRA